MDLGLNEVYPIEEVTKPIEIPVPRDMNIEKALEKVSPLNIESVVDLKPNKPLNIGTVASPDIKHVLTQVVKHKKGVCESPSKTPEEYQGYIAQNWPYPTMHAYTNALEPMLLYTAVRRYNMPNFMGARIEVPSLMNCDNWDKAFNDYHDKQVCQFVRYGWPLSYSSDQLPVSTEKNHKTALENPQQVTEFIEKECRLNAMVGPFKHPPFDRWSQVSPLLTRPKKDSDKLRVIIDLSFPEGASVNSGIQKQFYLGEPIKYSLPSILDLGELVKRAGKGSLMWKNDLARAYRQMRTCPLAYPLMCIKHEGAYYVDICPAFGCRISGASQQRVSQAVCHLMSEKGYTSLAYVDDFCGVGATLEEAQKGFEDFGAVCDFLGLQLAPEKAAAPSTRMEWLGFEIDSELMQISVPKSKLDEVVEEAKGWATKTLATKQELQSLVGKLAHISQVIQHARKFMCRVLANLRLAPAWGRVVVSKELRKDIAWFLEFSASFNGKLLIQPSYPVVKMECDACPQGGGGFCGKKYYFFDFPEEISEDHHIARLEAINLVICAKTLLPSNSSNIRLHILTDNIASAQVLMSGRTKDPVLAACAREMAMFTALRGIVLDVQHTPGEELELADALSRRCKSQVMKKKSIRLIKKYGMSRAKSVGLIKLIDVKI